MLTGKKYPALDGTERQAKTVGNLAILEAGNMHEERYAVITRKTVNDTVNLFRVVSIIGDVVVKLLRTVDVEKVVGSVNKDLVARLLAVVVDEDIAHYRVDPALEISPGGIFIHITQCL